MGGLTIGVTGSDAFFGRALVHALEKDPRVERIVAIDGRGDAGDHEKTEFHRMDLVHPRSAERLFELLRGADAVVHTAFVGRPVRTGEWAHELEAIGTRHVLTAAEAAGVRKVILRSTTLLYGASPKHPNLLRESAELAGARHGRFLRDKIEAEQQVARFAEKHPGRVATVLRFAPMLGTGADTIGSVYLARRTCPMLLGFDPLVQFVHEDDAVDATLRALHVDVRGAVNVAAPGVVPLSTAIRLAGGVPVPMPEFAVRPLARSLWIASFGDFPPGLVDFLKYLCVGDLRRMRDDLGFEPRHGIADALFAFAGASRLKRLAA